MQFEPAIAGKVRWKCATKPRGKCRQGCSRVFSGTGRTMEEAKVAAETACHEAGCHTPGGPHYNCNCGHTTCIRLPN